MTMIVVFVGILDGCEFGFRFGLDVWRLVLVAFGLLIIATFRWCCLIDLVDALVGLICMICVGLYASVLDSGNVVLVVLVSVVWVLVLIVLV